jgi:NAD(P)H-quinone oxidoreductase subunit 5
MTGLVELGFLTPLVPLAAATLGLALGGRSAERAGRLAELGALAATVCAAISLVGLVVGGPSSLVFGDGPALLSLRIEPISATLQLLIGFIGWVVIRYSRTYLVGAKGEARFHFVMPATLAAVLVLAASDSLLTFTLASVAVGIGLRALLLQLSSRKAAKRAASKFTLVWGLGDLALIFAAGLLAFAYGSSQFAMLAELSTSGSTLPGHLAAALIVLAAALKSAAFPLHGWVTEVMEAPTPVSAFLHAGIINSGGVLLIKMSGLVDHSPGAMAALVMIGGLTALFGATVMLTQSAVKTALAWSTVAQMGFMLLQCGLGLWTLALLHIVAHSFYKAYAFLSAGGAVRGVEAVRRPGPVAVPGVGAVARAFVVAIALYSAVAIFFDVVLGPKSAQALALGAILVFGIAYLIAQGLADAAPRQLTRRTAVASLLATLAYFFFHRLADWLWGGQLPGPPHAGPLEWALIVLTLISFGVVAIAQAMFPLWAHHPAAAGLRVHLANGLYLNALLDRLIGGLRVPAKSAASEQANGSP